VRNFASKFFNHLWRGTYAQYSCLAGFEHARTFAEGVRFSQQASAAPQQIFALRRELDTAADPVKQAHTQIDLHRANLSRESRLTDVQSISGAGEAARIGNGHEGTEVFEVHARLIAILHRKWNHKCIGHIDYDAPNV
jgi:hypothetical protein